MEIIKKHASKTIRAIDDSEEFDRQLSEIMNNPDIEIHSIEYSCVMSPHEVDKFFYSANITYSYTEPA